MAACSPHTGLQGCGEGRLPVCACLFLLDPLKFFFTFFYLMFCTLTSVLLKLQEKGCPAP